MVSAGINRRSAFTCPGYRPPAPGNYPDESAVGMMTRALGYACCPHSASRCRTHGACEATVQAMPVAGASQGMMRLARGITRAVCDTRRRGSSGAALETLALARRAFNGRFTVSRMTNCNSTTYRPSGHTMGETML